MENVLETTAVSTEQQVVVFTLGPEAFAIDIFRVHEIIRLREITKVPGAPAHTLGLINLRGKTIPVLDFAQILGVNQHEQNDDCRIIVVESPQGNVGLIVDSVKEVITFQSDCIEGAPSIVTENGGTSVSGVAKQEGKLITLVDLDQALAA